MTQDSDFEPIASEIEVSKRRPDPFFKAIMTEKALEAGLEILKTKPGTIS